jgi:hypothetical protein
MNTHPEVAVFLLGKDYHLGDLLWLTAVIRAYRERRAPSGIAVACPDRQISRILEHNPLIDCLAYGDRAVSLHSVRRELPGPLRVHDLRIIPLGVEMVRQWRRRLPWHYYTDLWLLPRGQWLASFLGLGTLESTRPVLQLVDEDRRAAARLAGPYVILAPHIGQYSVPVAGPIWQRVKGWPATHWVRLARLIRLEGYTPITLAGRGQTAIPGTTPVIGLPIRQAAAVIERASALVSGESGLWFIAAALGTPFAIVPWWLPRSVDWAAPAQVPYRLVYRDAASVNDVLEQVRELVTR